MLAALELLTLVADKWRHQPLGDASCEFAAPGQNRVSHDAFSG
jgi:hypothetical protein